MECLNKLEFYQTQWQKHVVMIGTGKNGHDYILDAHYEIEYSPTGGWIMDRTRIPNMEAKFDDIALLSDDVVVSARVPDSTKAYMCYIQKTPLAAGPFFVTSLIRRTQLPIYPSSEVLIQNTRMDTIYAVYKQSRFLTICQFKGENIVSSKRFSMPLIISPFIYATSSLLDVKADKPYKHINVLLSMKANTNQTLTDYRIYHIPLIQFASATSANVHIYNDYYTILHSLGRSKSGTSIAVGAYYSALWGIFRVQDNAEGNCATLQSVSLTTPSMVSPNYLSLTHSDEIIEMRETVMPVSPQSLDMITICQ